MSRSNDDVDVIVVGGGNAGHSAAHAAARRRRRVLLLERGVEDSAGGNSYYTAGAFRFAHGGLGDLEQLIEPDDRNAFAEVPAYTREMFFTDMDKVTSGRNNPGLTAVLVDDSREALSWLHEVGIRFRLMYERQAYQNNDGSFTFWGGIHVGSVDGGRGLMEQHARASKEEGVAVRYGATAYSLVTEDDIVVGVRFTDQDGSDREICAESVVLAAGGFEADAEKRRRYLGEEWVNAKVRGTPLNTGKMLDAALGIGAAPHGDWTSCHSVAWDAGYPDNESNREFTNQLTRSGYPLGIIVNTAGQRFVDEGEDFRNFTYAKFGAEILRQPGGIAFHIFDSVTRPMLRSEEYDMPGATEYVADTIEDLAGHMSVDPNALAQTVAAFNAGIDISTSFDPSVKDHRTSRVRPLKSNWAVAIDQPPFHAFPVTCGITFTFGGLAADSHGRVLDGDRNPIAGLYACGEMLGGLFIGNYPSGTGLTSGTVFGRRCGNLA